MNHLLASRFSESFTRLHLGLQPMDALRAQRIVHALELREEPATWSDPLTDDQRRWLERRVATGQALSDAWRRVPRHASGRHVLTYAAGRVAQVDVRVLDTSARVVPRRLRIPLAALGAPESMAVLDALPAGQRTRAPLLYPGAAYDVSEGVTGLRGRVVVRDGAPPTARPVRWPRIEARTAAGGAPVAWAHGDAHGEFLLLLPAESIAAPAVQLPATLTLSITAHGRRTVPAIMPPALVRRADPFWDLPLETLGAPGVVPASDAVALGRAIPADYDGAVTQSVTFRYAEIISRGVPPFDIT